VGWLNYRMCHLRMSMHLGCAIEAQALLTFVQKWPFRLLKV
jgi:hypothetical protein